MASSSVEREREATRDEETRRLRRTGLRLSDPTSASTTGRLSGASEVCKTPLEQLRNTVERGGSENDSV